MTVFLLVFLNSHAGAKQINSNLEVKQILAPESHKEDPGAPSHLRIPKINVDTAIEDVGVTHDGAMAVPKSINNVGWFNLGPRPGQKGSAVIAGHLDGKGGQTAVFSNLSKLKKGDMVYTEDNQGISTGFVVRESRTYDPGQADEVFSSNNDSTHLNLITCAGEWDKTEESYSKRLVVFADLVR